MDAFILPIVGGLLIGLASMGLLATLGRIAGISGIAWGAIASPDKTWRWLFLIGLVAGGALLHALTGVSHPPEPEGPLWLAALAGLIVGIGTRTGSGCTSGHGVCGIGRLSFRSAIATATFMFTGVLTVFIVRHLMGVML